VGAVIRYMKLATRDAMIPCPRAVDMQYLYITSYLCSKARDMPDLVFLSDTVCICCASYPARLGTAVCGLHCCRDLSTSL
jgi:hypothetical protein